MPFMSWKEACEQNGAVPKTVLADHVFGLINRKYKLEIGQESAANLCAANDRLAAGPLVIYVNHVRKGDALLMIPLALSLTNAERIMGPVGMTHYDLRRDPLAGTMFRALPFLHVYPSPVVQTKDTGSYSDERRQQMIDGLKARTSSILARPGSVYGITPEGTRHSTGVLLRANRGIGTLETYLEGSGLQLSYLPVGLIYKEFSDKPRIEVSPPFTLAELLPDTAVFSPESKEHAQQTADILMTVMARLLPEPMQGAYADPMPYFDAISLRSDQLLM